MLGQKLLPSSEPDTIYDLTAKGYLTQLNSLHKIWQFSATVWNYFQDFKIFAYILIFRFDFHFPQLTLRSKAGFNNALKHIYFTVLIISANV